MSAPNYALLDPVLPEAEASKRNFGGKAAICLSLLIGFGAGMCLMSQAPGTSMVQLIATPGALQVSMPRVGSTALALPQPAASPFTQGSRISSVDRVVAHGNKKGEGKHGSRMIRIRDKNTLRIRGPRQDRDGGSKPVDLSSVDPKIAAMIQEEGYNGHKVMYDGWKESTLRIAYRMWVETNREALKEEWLTISDRDKRVKYGMDESITGFWLGNKWAQLKWKAMDRDEKEPYMRDAAALKAATSKGRHPAELYLAQYGYGNASFGTQLRADLKAAQMRPGNLYWSVTKIEKARAQEALEAKWKVWQEEARKKRSVFR